MIGIEVSDDSKVGTDSEIMEVVQLEGRELKHGILLTCLRRQVFELIKEGKARSARDVAPTDNLTWIRGFEDGCD
jgi:hypothetical protein